MVLTFDIDNRGLNVYKVHITDDPLLKLTYMYMIARSNFFAFSFICEKM